MNIRRYLLFFSPAPLVACFAAFVLYRLASEAGSLANLDWPRFGVACFWAAALSLINYVLRFARWQMLLGRHGPLPPLRHSALCYFAGFAFTLIPGKAGELVRARYYGHWGVRAGPVGAAFVMERLMDLAVICLLGLLGLSAFAGASDHAAWSGGAAIALGIAVACLHLALIRAERKLAAEPADPAPSGSASRLRASLALVVGHGRQLMRRTILWPGHAMGVAAWALEGVDFWLLAHAGGLTGYAIGYAIAFYSASLLAGAVTFIPGGLGSTEAVMMFSLRQAGSTAEAAVAITLLCRLATLWLAIGLGWLSIAALALGRRGSAHAG